MRIAVNQRATALVLAKHAAHLVGVPLELIREIWVFGRDPFHDRPHELDVVDALRGQEEFFVDE